MDCTIRDNLKAGYTTALAIWTELEQSSGPDITTREGWAENEDFERRKNAAREGKEKAEKALEDHIRKHGCGPGE